MIFPHRQVRALLCIGSLLIVASCRSQTNTPLTNNNANDIVVSAVPPFKTKEPERYRATRVITSITADGKTQVTKHTIAKDGERRRLEYELMSKRVIVIETPAGKFVLLPVEKTYADEASESLPGDTTDDENSPERLLHTEDGRSSYQNLGTEVISGRNTNKYRVVVNSANATNVNASETLIWIDAALGMPIRSETKSADGSRVTMELSELGLEVDKNLFQLPPDYKKVTEAEMRRFLIPH